MAAPPDLQAKNRKLLRVLLGVLLFLFVGTILYVSFVKNH